MNFDHIVAFMRNAAPPVAWVILALVVLAMLKATWDYLVEKLGVSVGYVAVLAASLVWALWSNNLMYFAAFAIGMAAAFAEIIGKFRDEPIKALRTTEALIYHVLNGVIAAFALKVLILLGVPISGELDQIKAVGSAGLGSMLIMRSKIFDIKTKDGDQSFSFGPEQIVKVYFSFMEEAIDRARARSRVEFVESTMKDIDGGYGEVLNYTCTMVAAYQMMDAKKVDKLKRDIASIRTEDPTDPQLKAYRLGFLLLDAPLGENFLTRLFGQSRPEWRISARKPDEITKRRGIFSLGSRSEPEYVYYFAYGPSMSTNELFKRLRWTVDETGKRLAEAEKAELKGYRLVFNKPSTENPREQGLANIVPDTDGTVQGVAYRLPRENVDFLYKYLKGYRQQPVKVQLNGKEVDALTYVAESSREGLKPTKEYLDTLVAGASEHKLSGDAIAKLQSEETLSPSAPMRKSARRSSDGSPPKS